MSLQHSPKIVTNGLVLALDAANKKSYAGSGTTWTDLTGNGGSGSLVNAPTFSGTNGGNIVFNRTSTQYADFYAPNISTIAMVEMWVNVTEYVGMIMGWLSYDIYLDGPGVGYNAANGANYGVAKSTYSILNKWTHCVFKMTTGTITTDAKIYLNGNIQVLSDLVLPTNPIGSATGDLNGGNGRIAGWRNSTGQENSQAVASMKIYNRELSPQEVLQNFNATRGRFGL
jgi:hypothetical protein